MCGDSREQWVLDLVKCIDSKGESLLGPPVGHHSTIPFASATRHFPIWNLLALAEVLSLTSVFSSLPSSSALCQFVLPHLPLLNTFLCHLFLFHVHSRFRYMYVCVKVLNPLKLELQAVTSSHVGAGN